MFMMGGDFGLIKTILLCDGALLGDVGQPSDPLATVPVIRCRFLVVAPRASTSGAPVVPSRVVMVSSQPREGCFACDL